MSDISSSTAFSRAAAPSLLSAQDFSERIGGGKPAGPQRPLTENGKTQEKPRGDLVSFSSAAASLLAGDQGGGSDPATVNAPNITADVSPDPADTGPDLPEGEARPRNEALTSGVAAPLAATTPPDTPPSPADKAAREMAQTAAESADAGNTAPELAEESGPAPGFPSSPADSAAERIGSTRAERAAEHAYEPRSLRPKETPPSAPEAAAAQVTATAAERSAASKEKEAALAPSGKEPSAPQPPGSVIDVRS